MMSDVDLPAAHIRNQVASAIDVVVHLARLRDGRRVVWEIAAVEGTHRGEPVVAPLFRFRAATAATAAFEATGAVPQGRRHARRARRGRRRRLFEEGRGSVIGRRRRGLVALAGVFAERAVAITRSERDHDAAGRRRPARRSPQAEHAGCSPGRPRASWSIAGGSSGSVVATAGCAAVAVHTRASASARRPRATRATSSSPTRCGAIVGGLRAGLSLPQAFAYAADEVEEPLDGTLRDVVDAIDVGVPIDEALDGGPRRSAPTMRGSIAGVLDLHRRSGGDLPIVLDQVAETLRERRAAHARGPRPHGAGSAVGRHPRPAADRVLRLPLADVAARDARRDRHAGGDRRGRCSGSRSRDSRSCGSASSCEVR